MLSLGLANSRLKDYHDIWRLSRGWPFDGRQLAMAVADTARRRRTELPRRLPEGLGEEYAERWATSWQGLGDRFDVGGELQPLPAVLAELRAFLLPVLRAAHGPGFDELWPPGGPWTRREP